jgi:hypothetical protein
MTVKTIVGRCRTCQIPVRVDIDTETNEISAVHAVCDCPRPTVEQASRDRAMDQMRPELIASVATRDIDRTVAILKRMYPGDDPETHLRRRRVLLAAVRAG